jgi:hypothetical protein
LQEVEDAFCGQKQGQVNRDLAEAKEIHHRWNSIICREKKAINDVRTAEGKQTEQELANAKRKLKAITI